MSLESANAFVAKLKSDADFATDFRQKLAAAGPKEMSAVARVADFDFTDQELQQALLVNGATEVTELTEDELESVSGGYGTFSTQSYSLQTAGNTSMIFSFGGQTGGQTFIDLGADGQSG